MATGLYLVAAPAAMATAGDPVPGAMERMRAYPGLADAVTDVVFNAPHGRIHGHDADRIEVDVNDGDGEAQIRFVMPPDFELHGDRLVDCDRRGGKWRCHETSEGTR